MIIRQAQDGNYLIFTQHDHALASGEMSVKWGNEQFVFDVPERRSSVELAVKLHDIGWQKPDAELLIDAEGKMYDFIRYPLLPKLDLYRRGVDRVEKEDPYAGLLCSLHYSRFVEGEADAQRYLQDEILRRNRIIQSLEEKGIFIRHLVNEQYGVSGWVEYHFRLLRLCDTLSLLLCMTEPGSSSSSWIPWFGAGHLSMPQTMDRQVNVTISWQSKAHLTLDPFPFEGPFEIHLPFKCLSRIRFKSREACQEALHQASEKDLHVLMTAS